MIKSAESCPTKPEHLSAFSSKRVNNSLHDVEVSGLLKVARAARVFLDGACLLKSMPEIGRPMEDDTRRREELPSFGAGTFVLRYMWDKNDTVVIIRVWHSKEKRT